MVWIDLNWFIPCKFHTVHLIMFSFVFFLMLTCTVVLMLGCNWPYLAIVKHVNKWTELNYYYYYYLFFLHRFFLVLFLLNPGEPYHSGFTFLLLSLLLFLWSLFLSLAPISELDICITLRRLRPFKSVGLDNIPSFVVKGCSKITVPVLKHIFNVSLTQHYFPTIWKQAAVVPVLKKR
jgi:hypothetical protein